MDGVIIHLFEEVLDELMEGASPGEPFMMGTLRDIEFGFDSGIIEIFHQLLSAEVFFAACAEEEVMDFFFELIRFCEDSIIGRIDVESEDGTAKRAHI